MLSKMASKERPPGAQINIQNYYFITKISIIYLGHVIENSQLFVPLIIIIFARLHLSIHRF